MALDDSTLVTRTLEGDADAFGPLITRHQARVVNLLNRIVRDRETALDLAQEVFLKSYRSLDKLKDPSRFSSWLMQMAHNRGLDYLKKRRPDSMLTDFGDPKMDQLVSGAAPTRPDEDPAHVVERMSQPEVLEILDDLDLKYRVVLVLRYMEGYSFQQIADTLDLTLSTVKFRKFYAVKIMKEKILARRRLAERKEA